MGVGCKGLVFYRNNGKHGQGTHSTKMGADGLAENAPNDSNNFSPEYLPKPKSSRFLKKALWVSVVRGIRYYQTLRRFPIDYRCVEKFLKITQILFTG